MPSFSHTEGGGGLSSSVSRRSFIALACVVGLGLLAPHMRRVEVAEAVELGGVDLSLDDEASLYVGGNLTMQANGESEGICVVRGNFSGALQHVAGKVEWGLYGEPQVGTPSLLVGGNISCNGPVYCGTSAQIGGAVTGGSLHVATWENQMAYGGYTARAYVYGWRFNEATAAYECYDAGLEAAQRGCAVRTGMGRAAALTCVNALGRTINYDAYLDEKVRPMSAMLRDSANTGTASLEPLDLIGQTYYEPSMYAGRDVSTLDSTADARLVLTGDGSSSTQVFSFSLDWLSGELSRLGRSQIDLDVRDCPADSLVVINVSGRGSRTWRYGWNAYVDGANVTARPNMVPSRCGAFIQLCSRVLWNFHELDGTLTIDRGHGIVTHEAVHNWASVGVGNDVYNNAVGGANMMPGTILVPYGSMHIIGSTNGHVLIGGDLTAAWWEHHNVVWLGLATGKANLVKSVAESEQDWI